MSDRMNIDANEAVSWKGGTPQSAPVECSSSNMPIRGRMSPGVHAILRNSMG